MDDSEKPAFSLAITAMLVTFGQEATAPRLMGYWLGLRDLTLSQVESAVAKSMQTATRLPVPAELRSLSMGGSSSDRAIAAWGDVQKASATSYMVDLDFEDWIINAVVRNLGGRWNFFERLNAGAESEKWLRIEFLKCYSVLAETLPSDDAAKPLIGQATHGEACGRTHQPRLELVRSDPQRAAILPPRPVANIGHHKTSDVLRITYTDAEGVVTIRVISPIRFIKTGRDHVLALCTGREEPRQFALARISHCELIKASDVQMPEPIIEGVKQ